MRKDSFFNILVALLVVIAVLQFGDLFYFDIDKQIWWWDKLLHFLGGLWIGGMALWFFICKKKITPSVLSSVFISFGGAFIIGFGWELYEAGALKSFGLVFPIDYMRDTIIDLIADSAGGLVAAFLFLRLHQN